MGNENLGKKILAAFEKEELEEVTKDNIGYNFDWGNAPDAFKVLMQDVHKVWRQYGAENVSGSWAKNATANLFTKYIQSLEHLTDLEIFQSLNRGK